MDDEELGSSYDDPDFWDSLVPGFSPMPTLPISEVLSAANNPLGDTDILVEAFGDAPPANMETEEAEAIAVQIVLDSMRAAANAYLDHKAWLEGLAAG